MIKKILYVFIPIFAVLLMSHNVNAASKTYYLQHSIYAYGIPATTGGQGGSEVVPQTGQTFNLQNNIYSLPAGRIWYSMAFRYNSENNLENISQYTDFNFSFVYCSSSNQYFMPSSNDYYRITDYYEFEADTRTTIKGALENNISLDQYVTEKCRNVILKGKVGTGSSRSFQIGTTANGSFTRIFGFDYNQNFTTSNNLYIISPTVVLFDNPNEADEAIQKEKQNVQNAANNSSTSGNNSSTNSQNATSSLLSVITSGIGAITSASPTNCKINGNMGNLNVGNIDLCANPVPTFMAIIGSIIAVLVVLPLVILLFNRFISIIRSFQR